MNPTLILQAQQRKAQIKNNGTVEQLREVLKAVWPEDKSTVKGDGLFYFADRDEIGEWDVSEKDSTGLRIILLTDFYQPSFTWGQEVMWCGEVWQFVGVDPTMQEYAFVIKPRDRISATAAIAYLSPIPSKITPEQAAGEMYEMLKFVRADLYKNGFTVQVDEIDSLLNRIK